LIIGVNVSLAQAEAQTVLNPIVQQFTYGKSGVAARDSLSDNLIYYKISNNMGVPTTKKILIVCQVHGYEDAYPKDGQILKNIGTYLVKLAGENVDSLGTYEFYIVPSANPDALLYGTTNNGPGRCTIVSTAENSSTVVNQGIDLNRDWSVSFTANQTGRNKTGAQPFVSNEARALRDLIIQINPNVVIDLHGWENKVVGSNAIMQVIAPSLKLNQSSDGFYPSTSKRSTSSSGMLGFWAQERMRTTMLNDPTHKGDESLLIELNPPKYNYPNEAQMNEMVKDYGDRLFGAIKAITKDTVPVITAQKATLQQISLFINGEYIQFQGDSTYFNNTFYVPLNALVESLGYVIYFADNDIILSKAEVSISHPLNTNLLYIDAIEYQMKNPSMYYNYRTYVPIEFAEVIMKAEISYDQVNNVLSLNTFKLVP
jgi:hypothetical protein